MYLNVLALADISLGDGSTIDPQVYQGRKSEYRYSIHQWPRQARPPRSAWIQWQLAIDTIWTRHQTIEPPLGPWLTKPIMTWRWHHDLATNALYAMQSDNTIHKHEAIDHLQRRNRYYFSPFGEQCERMPLTASPVIPHTSHHALCCTAGSPTYQPAPPPQHTTFAALLTTQEKAYRDWLEYSFILDDSIENCITLIESGDGIIVVDGLFIPGSNIATASWVLASNAGPVQALGYSRLPSGDNENDPYRAEVFGLCLTLAFLQVLCTHRPSLDGRIIISCDNDEALRRGMEFDLWPRTQFSHFDLLATLHHLRQKAKLQFVPQRVKGHQDRLSKATLTRLEEFNVIADEAARTLAYQIERSRHIQSTLETPKHQWQISVEGWILKKKIREEIQDYVLGNQLKSFWIAKGRFSEANISFVDWVVLRQAVKRKPVHHQRWATKFLSGFCGSNSKVHQMGQHESPLCPRCGLFDETTDHILFCQHHSSHESRQEALKTLDRWLETSQTR